MTVDREAGAALLRLLREKRGWSWADLARALRDASGRLGLTSLLDRQVASIQRTVARWESLSGRTIPGERYQVLLAHVYSCTPTGTVSLGPGSDFDMLMDALGCFGVDSPRIRQLVEPVAQESIGSMDAPLRLLSQAVRFDAGDVVRDPTRLDTGVLDHLGNVVRALGRQVGTTSFARLQIELAPIVEVCRHLTGRDRPVDLAELLSLASQSYALAARLAFETRDDTASTELYRDALDAADRLSDRCLAAAVRTSYTMITLYATGNVETARGIARAATVDAHRSASHAIRARAHAVHAEMCARSGQEDASSVALDRARRTVEQVRMGDPYGEFDCDRLDGFEGICALHAGNPELAHDRLSNALDMLISPRDSVQRGIVGADLALARLRLGDPPGCAALMHDCVDITASTGGRVSAIRVRQVRQALRPWRAEGFVAELDDHIYQALIG